MKKYEKEILQSQLDMEAAELKKLKAIYMQAADDCAKKIKFQTGKIDALLNEWDDLGEKEKSILQSQIYQRKYQQALQKQISDIIDNMNNKQYATVSEYLTDCYENGFASAMYSLHKQGVPIIMPLDQKAAVKGAKLDSKVSKKLYGSYVAELKKRIRSEVSRGVATSLPYKDIARNLNMQTNIGLNRAMRIARTEGHHVQVSSSYETSQRAKENGADVLKQWSAALDGRTRESHARVDGEIRELDEKFSNGLKYPGDSAGGAAEVVNCRCALLQRAKWALDEDELETLKERAAYYGLDKTKGFEDFKGKYIKAAAQVEVDSIIAAPVKPIEVVESKKKEYLTEKKLKSNISDAELQLSSLNNEFEQMTGLNYADIDVADYIKQHHSSLSAYDMYKLKLLDENIKDIDIQKADWESKLNKKLVAKETKQLKKEKTALVDEKAVLKDELAAQPIKTYSGIWKDDVTTADYAAKMGSIKAKEDYFKHKLSLATSTDDINKWQGLLDKLADFEKGGAEYFAIQQKLNKTEKAIKQIDQKLDKIKKGGKISAPVDDKFSQERKDAALWAKNTKDADAILRDTCGEVWRNASDIEKDSIYEYTSSYHKFNEPLRGIEYGTNKYLGVGNVDLEQIGVNYGGYKVGQVKKQIDAMTSIIEKSIYQEDIWVQRGCGYGGMDKFFGIDPNDFNLPENELAAKLLGTTPTEYGFCSTGVSKGKGFSHQPIIMNIYAPAGTKMMYAEPFSAFGNGSGRRWDGVSTQSSFGSEAEMIFQRETTFRVTKVEKSGGKIYIDLEVIGQGVF